MKRREFLGLAGAALLSGPKLAIAQPNPSKKLRIVVVANRYHEADGLMAALGNQMARNTNFSFPYNVIWPRAFPPDPNVSQKPRCLIDILKNPAGNALSATMEIWCIDDLADVRGDSAAKVTAMDLITNYTNPPSAPDGVVAFGTAGYPDLASNDGCATIGGTVFIHDASNDVPGHHGGSWSWSGYMGVLVRSKIPGSFFTDVAADQKTLDAISSEMIAPQLRPASLLQLLIDPEAVGISSVGRIRPEPKT